LHSADPPIVSEEPDGARLRSKSPQPTTANEDLVNCLPYTMSRWNDTQGGPIQEYWLVTGMDHAWSGGAAAGSYADTRGPDATKAMWAFFANHRLPG
jgi:poly(3-hydroxybutyrate) depolymerase